MHRCWLMKLNHKQHSCGFTLIEVLIALVILAIAFLAVIKVTQDSIVNTAHIRNNLIAHWVAMNVISKIQVGLLAKPKDAQGQSGQQQYLNQQWQWKVMIDGTSDQKSYQSIVVTVSQKGKQYTRLVGFVKK